MGINSNTINYPYGTSMHQDVLPSHHPHCLLLQVIIVVWYDHTFSEYCFSHSLKGLCYPCLQYVGFGGVSKGKDRLEEHFSGMRWMDSASDLVDW